ncbi:MAG: L-serine ammonia-lyase, iron-sulfur-dependent, subunit alpha [bacterium]|nr:L-serine ammonia-lyase, iron-sulfur-dependent, subunit alpha [bacterium]
MKGLPPSIFNDVIGPVMRGPSSSHSAASVRIARLARDLCGGDAERVLVEFDVHGSLPTTHKSQGSDMGLFGGLLGWEADDERLPESEAALAAAGVACEIRYVDLHDPHPNTYRLTVTRGGIEHHLVAISTGGGMITVESIDGCNVALFGDREVTLLDLASTATADVAKSTLERLPVDVVELATGGGGAAAMLVVQSQRPITDEEIEDAGLDSTFTRIRRLHPVLPVRSRPDVEVPFLHASELDAHGDVATQRLSDFALDYECARGGIDHDAVFAMTRRIRDIMRAGVDQGLAGTSYPDRILPQQSDRFAEMLQRGELLDGGILNQATLYVSALMEVKSSMGVIVAAPTAGSCATFPGTCLAAADAVDADEETTLRAMLAAGLIGIFVTTRSSFAAEVGGCQAETGAGAAMAAAALVELRQGPAKVALSAASHALQNVLGLVCDPIANRVEAPCLGRNITGAANALSCANIALAGYDHLVPLDQVLDAHREISENMARELRCTALGGLSITPASKAIEAKLCGNGDGGCGSCD